MVKAIVIAGSTYPIPTRPRIRTGGVRLPPAGAVSRALGLLP